MNIFQAMKPNLTASSVMEIPFSDLKAQGKTTVLLDFDNTLGPDHATAPGEFAFEVIKMLSDLGYKMILVSNAKSGRSSGIAEKLGIPCITYAHKPRPVGVIKAMEKTGATPDQCIMVGDQVFTDVIAGRLAGVYTVMVDKYSPKEIWYVVLKRPFEKIVRLIGRF